MIKSIQQFGEVGVKYLEEMIEKFVIEPKNHADFIYGVTENVINLGLSIIAETLEGMDEELRSSGLRKKNWHIVKRDETTLLTSLGNVTYHKTLFLNKESGKRSYLLDQLMELKSHARMTEDAEAKILEEAVESSYRKGGKEFKKVYRELKNYAETESKKEAIEEARRYLLSHWNGIIIYNQEGEAIKGCREKGCLWLQEQKD